MRAIHIILTFVVAVAMLSASACQKPQAKSAEVPPVPVTVAPPTQGTITDWYKTTAELVSPLETPLSFAIGGRILELTAQQGDKVTAGQYLGKVDTATYAAQLAAAQSGANAAASQAKAANSSAQAAKSSLATAQANFDQAERDYNRFKTLHDEGVATQSEFEKAQLGYEAAKNGLQAAKDGAAAADSQATAAHTLVQAAQDNASQVSELIGNGTLTAPFSGHIAERLADPGAVAAPGVPVYRLVADGDANNNRLEVHYDIPESLLGQVSVGSSVELTLVSMDKVIPLKVDSIGPEVKTGGRTTALVSYVTTDSLPLLPGMFGSVQIPVQQRANALMVPDLAVLELTSGPIIYVADGDTAHARTVKTGIHEAGNVEILDGISATDKVIVAGNRYLADGAKITVQQAPPEGATSGSTANQQDVTGSGNSSTGGAH